MDRLVYNPTLEDWRIHNGLDIAAQEGTSVLAASSGTVLSVKDDALMGTTVTLDRKAASAPAPTPAVSTLPAA